MADHTAMRAYRAIRPQQSFKVLLGGNVIVEARGGKYVGHDTSKPQFMPRY
jgi:hypothetical protein